MRRTRHAGKGHGVLAEELIRVGDEDADEPQLAALAGRIGPPGDSDARALDFFFPARFPTVVWPLTALNNNNYYFHSKFFISLGGWINSPADHQISIGDISVF